MPRPIVDPRVAAVVGTDGHLPALGPERLTVSALRTRFEQVWPGPAELAGDGGGDGGGGISSREPASAAVLVGLVHREGGLRVLLTRRSDHLRDHAGQISFPGGRTEPSDKDAAATALRETEEEVGLRRSQIQVLGVLPTYTTVTSYAVTPVVAILTPPLLLSLDSAEVSEAFEVPLEYLMDPAHHRRHVFIYDGGERHFLSMPWQAAAADGAVQDYFIWGATAAMLRNLYGFLAR